MLCQYKSELPEVTQGPSMTYYLQAPCVCPLFFQKVNNVIPLKKEFGDNSETQVPMSKVIWRHNSDIRFSTDCNQCA
jgi:hypothetical protein